MKWSPGDELAQHMNLLGQSVSEAATTIGVSRDSVHRLISGEGGPSLALARKLAAAYDTTVAHWMDIKFEYERERK